MPTAIRAYIRSLGIDAYVVGGAVRDELLGIPHRDEDFLVPGVDQAGLRALLEPHGRVEDMRGARTARRRAPASDATGRCGRSCRPASTSRRRARSGRPGPGHRDFAIVSDASIELEEDMARRDFTINAMARRLEDGSLVDPFGGVDDLERAPAAHRRADELRGRSAPARPRPAVRLAARLRPRTRDAGPDARRRSRARARLGRADRRRDQGRRARASSRSSCSADSLPARSSSRATRASSRA